MNLLPWTIYLSFAGALAIGALGARSAQVARVLALITAVAGAGVAAISAVGFVAPTGITTLVEVDWVPEWGLRYHLAADGISLALIVLTAIAAIAGVLFSWNVDRQPHQFFALYFALIGGVYGVFLSADAMLLFVFYEIAIVPKYFLIARWGSTRREYGAMKLVLYSFAGSALVLAGLVWAYARGGGSFGLAELAAGGFRVSEQRGMFALVFFGFAVLAGLFPFHTWAPTGHVAAPTGASMLLAGVVMKLGAYGCLRVAMPLFPDGFAFWQAPIAWLALVGIVYAGLTALVQTDLKFVVGYSSVSHMGFVMLGLATGNARGASGAVLQMVSHGLIAGLLFAVVGRMVYDRTHTRDLERLGTMGLYRRLPFVAFTFVVAGFASMGMPGFSGFPAELTILVGAWKTAPVWTVVAVTGVIVAAAFTLRAVHKTFFVSGNESQVGSTGHEQAFDRLTWAERAGAVLLLTAIVLVGVKPDYLLAWIEPGLKAGSFQGVWKGLP